MPSKTQLTEDKKLHKEIVKQMVTLSASGFGLVAALSWNNVIQELVNTYIKPYLPNGGLLSLLIYATSLRRSPSPSPTSLRSYRTD